jgi:hypothetical protein
MALDYLFNGAPPQDVTSSVSSITGMPDWYQEYLRGIAGKATEVAGQGFTQYPGQRLQDFTPDQQSSFDLTRQTVGGWQPYQQGALSAANQTLPTASAFLGAGAQYGANAVGSVNPNAANWTQNWQQYMSPYTSSVVNEIGRLGNRNLQENILSPLNDSFIGSGGFGSDRNADMIGRSIRDAQRDISGQQSLALQQGYGTSANIFGADANRQQQQQQLMANTNLQAGSMANAGAQIGSAASDQAAQRYGALGQLGQQLGYQDAGALGTIGGQQQQLGQQGLDIGYQNFLTQQGWNWNTLNNLNSVLRGMQLPTSQTQVSNNPYGNVGTSPLQWAGALLGAGTANTQPATQRTGP